MLLFDCVSVSSDYWCSFSSGLDSPTPVELKDEKAQEQEASSSGVENEAVDGLNPFARIWRAYNNVLHERPILVKSATSFFGFLAGDIIAQIIVAQPFNYWRTLRLVLFGMFMDGPVGKCLGPTRRLRLVCATRLRPGCETHICGEGLAYTLVMHWQTKAWFT